MTGSSARPRMDSPFLSSPSTSPRRSLLSALSGDGQAGRLLAQQDRARPRQSTPPTRPAPRPSPVPWPLLAKLESYGAGIGEELAGVLPSLTAQATDAL